MEDGGWRIEDGGWKDGGWRMEDGGWMIGIARRYISKTELLG